MSEKFTPGPWLARDIAGAGWEIFATLPEGFKFDATYRGADGKTQFMIWQMTSPQNLMIECERWVQFETSAWKAMQEHNAHLIAAAPEMYRYLELINKIASPNPERTFDGVIRDLKDITDFARAALAKARGEV